MLLAESRSDTVKKTSKFKTFFFAHGMQSVSYDFRINNYVCPCAVITLLKEMWEGRKDEEGDVSIYWVTVKIREDTGS